MQVRGLIDPVISGRVHNLPLHAGGAWFNEVQTVEVDGQSVEAIQGVLGEGIARELGHDRGKPSLEPGDVFDLGPRKWVVTGILQSSGSTFDSEVWAKQDKIGKMFGKESYTTVVLRTPNADDGEERGRRPVEELQNAGRVGPAGDGILREAEHDQPAIPLHDHLYRHHHGRGRRVRRDEHDVRGHELSGPRTSASCASWATGAGRC